MTLWVDGRCDGHGLSKDLFPLGENQIAGQRMRLSAVNLLFGQ